MAPRYTTRLHGSTVEILDDGQIVGRGRWTGRRIEDCPARLADDAAASEALYERLEEALAAEVNAALAAMPTSFDQDGVDMSLLDWMLELTPTQRLRTLQSWVDTFGAAIVQADS